MGQSATRRAPCGSLGPLSTVPHTYTAPIYLPPFCSPWLKPPSHPCLISRRRPAHRQLGAHAPAPPRSPQSPSEADAASRASPPVKPCRAATIRAPRTATTRPPPSRPTSRARLRLRCWTTGQPQGTRRMPGRPRRAASARWMTRWISVPILMPRSGELFQRLTRLGGYPAGPCDARF